MSDSLTLRVLDQIRINGFEVELDADAGTISVFEPGDRRHTERTFSFSAAPTAERLRELATPFCTMPQVQSLFRPTLRRAS